MNRLDFDFDDNNHKQLLESCVRCLYEEAKTKFRYGVSKHSIEVVAGYVSAPTLENMFTEIGWLPSFVRTTPIGSFLCMCINKPDDLEFLQEHTKIMKWLINPSYEYRIPLFLKMRNELIKAGVEHPIVESIFSCLKALGYPTTPDAYKTEETFYDS